MDKSIIFAGHDAVIIRIAGNTSGAGGFEKDLYDSWICAGENSDQVLLYG